MIACLFSPRWLPIVAAVLCCSDMALADRQVTRPVNGIRDAAPRTHALVGATVVTAPGAHLESATIVIRDGVIVDVGVGIDVPPEARVWSVEGLRIYPGLIDPAVIIDADQMPAGPGRHWHDRVHPEVRLARHEAAVTPSLRRALREQGFTAAGLQPKQGILRGSGVVIAPAADDEDVRVYAEPTAMMIGLDDRGRWSKPSHPGSLMGAIALVRQTLLDAEWFDRCRRIYDAHPQGNEPPAPNDALAALAPLLRGEQTVLFDVTSELDALRTARIAREFGLQAMLLGSGLEFRRLDEVVATGLPIIVPLKFPDAPDVSEITKADRTSLRELQTWEQAPTNARRLHDRGVEIAFTMHRLDKRRDFFPAVRKAVQYGLSEDAALAAMTVTPARMLGLERIMGTIEPGKAANFIVTDKSLFAKRFHIHETWINGERYEITPRPDEPIRIVGTLELEDGRRLPMTIDSAKGKVTLEYDGETFEGKAHATGDRVTLTMKGEAFDAEGLVQLGAARTDGALTGLAVLHDGRRLAFTVTPDPAAVVEDDAKNENHAELKGHWTLTLDDVDREAMTLVIEEVTPDHAIVGKIRVGGETFEIDEGSYDFGNARLEVTYALPSDTVVRIEATIDDLDAPVLVGEVIENGGSIAFSGERQAAVKVDEFEMPPEELVVPLGAYGMKGAPEPQDVLVVNATIWTCGPEGIIENGAMLVRDGRIEGVYREAPNIGVARMDLGGRHVTPGLIDCHSHTGISGGVNEFAETNTAEVSIGDVINPDDVNWYRQLAGGLTAANQLHGSANPIGGQNSVVKLKWGGTAADFSIDGAIGGIKFALGENVKRSTNRYPNTRMGVETFIRDAFAAAEAYHAEHERYAMLSSSERDRTIPPRRDLELEALVEILDGQRLIHCHSYRQDEILMLVRVAEAYGFRIGTFQHVLEGYKVAEAIGAHGAGASSFSDWWAYKVEVMDAIPYNGALMTSVGVNVSFNSDSSEVARRMNTEASKAVRYGGMDEHEALKLVTLHPAQQLGLGDRIGSLEAGKDADFAVWSGSPLSTLTICEQTWIDGARHFQLEDDRIRRAKVTAERQRLLQKALTDRHGGSSRARTARASAMTDEEIAWREEQIRLGNDPAEILQGMCGEGFDAHHHH